MTDTHPSGMSLKAELASDGFRMTKLRNTLLEFMSKNTRPFSVDEICHHLKKIGLTNHRVTVYRELERLTTINVLEPVLFHDGIRRYELIDNGHHHHVICTNCDHVEDVALKTELDEEEKRIERKTKFQITRHSLEFFGLCASCRS